MRIIHLNTDRGISPRRAKGAAIHLAAMRKAFADLGAEIVSIDEPNPSVGARRLEDVYSSDGVDILYERLALDSSVGSDFARRRGVRHVLEVNAPLDEEQERYRDARRSIETQSQLKSALTFASEVLCVSRACAAWAVEMGAPSERVLVAGNGVDAARFHPSRRKEAQAVHGIDEETFVVGFHGRLRPWHGFERISAAVATMHQQGCPVHLLVVGRGEFTPLVAPQLPDHAWTHIEWIAHEEVGALVARFDALPLAYSPDQPCYFSPLKLLEGMAAGAVALVPDLGDLAAEVRHGAAGVVYDPRDSHALSREMIGLYESPSRRAALTAEARKVAELRSWRGIARGVISRTESSA